MIFAKIWSADLDNPNSTGRSLVAKVNEYGFNTPSEYWGPGAKGVIEIRGEGYHKGSREPWNYPDENQADYDHEDKLDIRLEKNDIIEIFKKALDKKIIEISDVISEERLQELRNSCEKIKSEADKIISNFAKAL